MQSSNSTYFPMPLSTIQKKQIFYDNLDEKQKTIFNELKKIVTLRAEEILKDQIQNVSKVIDDNQLVRLLLAREFKLQDALVMWEKWVQWRVEVRADFISEDECYEDLKSGKVFWHGYDKQNNPVLIIKTKLHFPKQTSPEKTIKLFLFLMEQAIKLSEETGTERVTIIWDREGFSQFKNWDTSMFGVVRKIIQILQDNYAERLSTIIILYPNLFFKSIFALLSPFLSQRSKQKFQLISKVSDLQKHIDENQLLVEHGGKSQYIYQYPPGHPVIGQQSNIQNNQADKQFHGEKINLFIPNQQEEEDIQKQLELQLSLQNNDEAVTSLE